MRLRIELLSDLCAGSGEAVAGIVDTEVTSDPYGIPLIPGRRIKGLFREAAKELLEYSMVSKEAVEAMFGMPGEEGPGIYFDTLYPTDYTKMRDLLREMEQNEELKRFTEKEWVRSFYMDVRTHTAIDANGIADENTLRNIRVICQKHGSNEKAQNLVFEGDVQLSGEMKEEQKQLLIKCAQIVRHMGLYRTRGYGNVKCSFSEIEDSVDNIALECCREQEKEANRIENSSIGVLLNLEQPCVMESDYISGRMLCGVFAGAKMQQLRKEGKNTEQLHKDEDFYRLFLSGEVEYGFCWPYENKRVYYPIPLSFLREKKSTNNKVYDLAGCEEDKEEEFLNEKERFANGFASFQISNGEVDGYCKTVQRVSENHHRRPEDRSMGHAARKNESNVMAAGQLFSMEMVKEDQEFFGEIRGSEELLKKLKELIPEGGVLHLGASRTAQYGKARIHYINYKEREGDEEQEDRTVISLRSPLVVTDCYGRESTDLEDVFRTILPGKKLSDYHVLPIFKEETFGGYQAKWRMPIPQRRGLAAGSVMVIYDDLDLEEEEAREMEQRSYGKYRSEGYGRIAVNRHGQAETGNLQEKIAKQSGRKSMNLRDYNACEPKAYMDICLRRRVLEECERIDCMRKIKRRISEVPNAHVLSGMMQVIRTSSDFGLLKKQLNKASERATKKNAEWYKKICMEIYTEQGSENIFQKQSIWSVRERKAFWGDQMERLLGEKEGFPIFQEIMNQMLYEAHYKQGKR